MMACPGPECLYPDNNSWIKSIKTHSLPMSTRSWSKMPVLMRMGLQCERMFKVKFHTTGL